MNGEAGADVVYGALPEAVISAVNLSEVVARLTEKGVDESAIERSVRDMALRVIPLDEALAVKAGLLRRLTKSLGLSLGDRCCLALAQEVGLPVLTADRIWGQLNLSGITVQVIR